MTKSKREAKDETALERDRKNYIRLRSVKSDFKAGNVKSLRQIFDVVAESWFAQKMGMGFTTLRNKTYSPGEFSINEIKRMAELLEVDFNGLLEFILKETLRVEKRIKK